MQHYGGRFLMYAVCVCACVCVLACMRERWWGKVFLELPHNPLFGQLVWTCISLLLLLFYSLVVTSIFYFNVIDYGWGRNWARLISPVATNVKPAFIPKFIRTLFTVRTFCHSWTELDQLPKRLLLSCTLDNEKVHHRTNISWQTFSIILEAAYLWLF